MQSPPSPEVVHIINALAEVQKRGAEKEDMVLLESILAAVTSLDRRLQALEA